MLKNILSKIVIVSFMLTTLAPAVVLAQTGDAVAPVIKRLGAESISVIVGHTYLDRGAIAWDSVDGNITNKIVTVNPVSTSTIGTYAITYNVSDSAGNAALQVTRTVNIVATVTPSPIPVPANERVILQGHVTAISGNSFSLETKKYGPQSVSTVTTTIIVTRGKLAQLSDIFVGAKVMVVGQLNSATNIIAADFVNIISKKVHKDNGWHGLKGKFVSNEHQTSKDLDSKKKD